VIYTGSYSSFGADDRMALRSLMEKVCRPGCRILEIGSWLGTGSTRVMIEMMVPYDDARLYCVDTWKGSPNVRQHLEIAEKYDVFQTFMNNVVKAGGDGRVFPLVMGSVHAAEIMRDGFFDLIFIDGDHSYHATRNDIAAWRGKVRAGGILCGHDCECRPNVIAKDIDLFAEGMDHIPGDGTPFAVIHPGVVVSVEEAFSGAANLWAERSFKRPDGTDGRATLWDIVL